MKVVNEYFSTKWDLGMSTRELNGKICSQNRTELYHEIRILVNCEYCGKGIYVIQRGNFIIDRAYIRPCCAHSCTKGKSV